MTLYDTDPTQDGDGAELDISLEQLERILHNASGEPLTWGATPLDTFTVQAQQNDVRNELAALSAEGVELPFYVSPEVRKYVATIFQSRFFARGMANKENYEKRLVPAAHDFDDIVATMLTKAKQGSASPAELILLRSRLGMAGTELGCVTHPYGQRIELLDEMRKAVREAVEIFDGTPLLGVHYALKNSNMSFGAKGSKIDDALLMTRKTDIGILPDGTMIRERSSFIVPIYPESGFNQQLAANIKKIIISDNDNWVEEVMTAGNLAEITPTLLETNDFHAAIPLSTTTYAYNAKTKELIQNILDQQELERKADSQVFKS